MEKFEKLSIEIVEIKNDEIIATSPVGGNREAGKPGDLNLD